MSSRRGRRRRSCSGAAALDRDRSRVALVALLEPGISTVVVAVALPEPGLVLGQELEAGDPLGRLPEVQVRHQEPDRTTVLPSQRLAPEGPDHPGLAAGDV